MSTAEGNSQNELEQIGDRKASASDTLVTADFQKSWTKQLICGYTAIVRAFVVQGIHRRFQVFLLGTW